MTTQPPDMIDAATLHTCYSALLGRQCDKVGLDHWLDPSQNGALADLLTTIVGSEEFAVRWREEMQRRSGQGEMRFFNEQSQFGEVGLLLRQIVNRTSLTRIVVDVGANGRERSNSYDLLRHFGWYGLLIEANPKREEIIRRDFAGLNFHLVGCAVSDYSGEATFHIGQNDDVSSLQKDSAESWGPTRGTVTVQVRPLSAILQEVGIPKRFDVLSIDAEGEDTRILNSVVAAGYRPSWVILECPAAGVDDSDLRTAGLSDVVASSFEAVGRTEANLMLRLCDVTDGTC